MQIILFFRRFGVYEKEAEINVQKYRNVQIMTKWCFEKQKNRTETAGKIAAFVLLIFI